MEDSTTSVGVLPFLVLSFLSMSPARPCVSNKGILGPFLPPMDL